MITIGTTQYHGPLECGDVVSQRYPCPHGYSKHKTIPHRYIPTAGRKPVTARKRGPCRNCRGL